MEYEEIVRKLGEYDKGTVLNITWARGNGKLSADYVYFGRNDKETPILKRHEEGRTLDDYVNVVSFDISNPDFDIIGVNVIAHKSAELIGD